MLTDFTSQLYCSSKQPQNSDEAALCAGISPLHGKGKVWCCHHSDYICTINTVLTLVMQLSSKQQMLFIRQSPKVFTCFPQGILILRDYYFSCKFNCMSESKGQSLPNLYSTKNIKLCFVVHSAIIENLYRYNAKSSSVKMS